MKRIVIIIACLLVVACGTSAKKIQPSYVSPMEYQSYSCRQLEAEVARVTRRANTLAGDIDKNAQGDTAAMTAGLILFWPALFFIDGDHPNQTEYGELLGRMNAIEEVAVKKSCNISFPEPVAAPVANSGPSKGKNWKASTQ